MATYNDDFHRQLVHKLASSALNEQRARRRWGIFFKSLFFLYLIIITALYYQNDYGDGYDLGSDKYAAVITISGVISADGPNSANAVNAILRSAFESDKNVGIIMEINSPGGSAVESNRIYNEIRRLREKYPEKPIIAVAGDFCASGGYYIAAAADSIYADPASIVGSIGVIYSGFGFVEALEKLGVERRVQTAGGSKNLSDPFLPQQEEGQQVIGDMLADVHQVFTEAVKNGRGERLSDDARIFTGAFFSGSDSVALGLTDGLNDIGGVARDIIGTEHILYYQETRWWDNIVPQFVSILLNYSGGVQAVAHR